VNYRTISILLLALNACLGYMLYESRANEKNLFKLVRLLDAELSKPHPIHDAQVTAWLNHDRFLTIVVNGQFKHPTGLTCYEGKTGRL
jgi:hypothetical protein